MTAAASSAALYARVSTTLQDPAMQLTALHEYAARRGVEPIEYVDLGASGAATRRPKLDELMADARRHRFAVVAVWKFDRAARSVAHLADMLREFQALEIAFVSITEAVDTATPAGRMLYHVLAAVAEFERDLIRERVAAGLAQAKRDGRRVGRPQLHLDAEELRRHREAGLSVRDIAAVVVGRDDNGGVRAPSPSLVARTLRESATPAR